MIKIDSGRCIDLLRPFLLLTLAPSMQRKIFNLPEGTACPDGGFF